MKLHKILSGVLALVMAFTMVLAVPVNAVEDSTPVAKIGDTEYATIKAAIEAVPKNTPTTITLLCDATTTGPMVGHQYTQNITIDLGGHTLSNNGIVLTAYRAGTTLTLQNGTVKGNATTGTLRATYGGKIVLGDDLTVAGAGGSAVLVYADNGTVEVAAENGVQFEGGKQDWKESSNENNKLVVGACINRTYFATLDDALAAAEAGDTVTMMADVDSSAIGAIDKASTLDGNGKTLTSTAGRAINVVTEGDVTIQNLTINASGERAINVIQKPAVLTVDNVTAVAANYTVNLASSAGAAKVTITNSDLTGLNVVNVAAAGAEVTVTNTAITCNDQNEDENYGALTLNKDATDAKIIATDVNLDVKGDSLKAVNSAMNGVITINGSDAEVRKVVAVITYKDSDYYNAFYSLADAIAAAKDGDVITLMADITVDNDDFDILDDCYYTFFKIEGKSITIDLNGKVVYANVTGSVDKMIVGVFSTDNGGHLTLNDSAQGGAVKATSGENPYLVPEKGNTDYNYKFYALLVNYESGCTITVNGGHYSLDFAGDSLAYTGANEGIIVYGGEFDLGNLGGIRNGMPWIFNASGQNTRHVLVYGGNFCADVQHQYYPFEVLMPKELALKKEDGRFVTVDAVAYVNEQEFSGKWYTNEIGYATVEEAEAAVEAPKTAWNGKVSAQEYVTLLVTLTENVVVQGVNAINKATDINLGGNTMTSQNVDATGADKYSTLTLYADTTISGEGVVENTVGYGVTLREEGITVTIKDGTFIGGTTAINVVKGTLVIEGGFFQETTEGDENGHYLINCIDANYKNGIANVMIIGGTFVNWDPSNNTSEGVGTNFVADGYTVVAEEQANGDIWYTVIPA